MCAPHTSLHTCVDACRACSDLGSLIENFISRRAVPRRNRVSSCFSSSRSSIGLAASGPPVLASAEKWGLGRGLDTLLQASGSCLIPSQPFLHPVPSLPSDLMHFPMSSSHGVRSVSPALTLPSLESGPLAMSRGTSSSPLLGELLEEHSR